MPCSRTIERECRHYISDYGGIVICRISDRSNCHECKVCPKCGSHVTYSDTNAAGVSVEVFGGKEVVRIIQVRVCPLCGHRTRGLDMFVPVHNGHSTDEYDRFNCEVAGCRRGAWEMHTFLGRFICSFHRGQIQTFRYSKMAEHRFPLLLKDGNLIENTEFNLYKARSKK